MLICYFSHTYCDVFWLKINQDAVEYAECEAVVKDFPPFREAMKRRGIEDMDLVMVDPWLVTALRLIFMDFMGKHVLSACIY